MLKPENKVNFSREKLPKRIMYLFEKLPRYSFVNSLKSL